MGSFGNVTIYNCYDDICGHPSMLPLLPSSQIEENYSLLCKSLEKRKCWFFEIDDRMKKKWYNNCNYFLDNKYQEKSQS